MVSKSMYDNTWSMEREEMVDDEWLTLTISHTLDLVNPKYSGWFADITVNNEETGEPEWGFCVGWCPSFPEVIKALKEHESYKDYPFPLRALDKQ